MVCSSLWGRPKSSAAPGGAILHCLQRAVLHRLLSLVGPSYIVCSPNHPTLPMTTSATGAGFHESPEVLKHKILNRGLLPKLLFWPWKPNFRCPYWSVSPSLTNPLWKGQITDWSCSEALSFTNPLWKGQITDWSWSEAFSFTNPFWKR